MCLHISYISDRILLLLLLLLTRNRRSLIQSISEISDGLDITSFKTNQNMKYLIDGSSRLGFCAKQQIKDRTFQRGVLPPSSGVTESGSRGCLK